MRWQKLGSVESGRKMRRVFDEVMWFIDNRPWTLVLSVDAKGTVTGGRKVALAEAIKLGASVHFFSFDGGLVGPDNLVLNGNDVDAQSNDHISIRTPTDNANEIEFQNNPFWWFTIITTTGRRVQSRWTYGRHESRSRNVEDAPFDWFVSY